MKLFTSLITFLIFSFIPFIEAQDCQMSTAQADLVTPRVKVRHHASADLWWDGAEGKFLVDDPTLSTNPVSAAFAASFWAGGTDQGNNLKFAGNTYGRSSGKTDWWPGPLSDVGESPAENCMNFDRIWEIKAVDISAFEMDYNDNGVIDNPIHPTLQMWPGKDNPMSLVQNGFELPVGRSLAPFIDRNNDGIYNPADGDFPDVKGANVAHWWIFNDNGNIHTSSNGNEIKMDVGVLAYSFSTDPFDVSTVFYEFLITNKAIEPFVNFHAGLWLDIDLGCYSDDYIGCIPSENLAFAYNQDAVDGTTGTSCNGGVNSFDIGIPLFGIRILEGTKTQEGVDNGMSSFIYYNNQNFSPNPATTDPATSPEMNNYLRGLWRDGTPITIGGDGYDPASTDVTNFAFPDPPNSITGWSMCNPIAESGDRRVVIGSGESDLDPGESTKFAFAAIVTKKVEHPCPDITSLIDAANDAQDIYDMLPSRLNAPISKANFSIQPNPSNDFINIRTQGFDQIHKIELFNISGQLLRSWQVVNSYSYQINVDDFVNGMYLIKVKMKDGSVGVKRVVVE